MVDERSMKEALVSETDPIALRPVQSGANFTKITANGYAKHGARPVCFTRKELQDILNVYGRNVAAGEWRDYAIDMEKDKATFSIFRRTSEMPLYRIEKNPSLNKRQGMYALVNSHGHVLKRGHDLPQVLKAIKNIKNSKGKAKKAQIIRAF